MTTLEDIRDLDAGAAFPGALLRGRKDALVLFAAGFLGKQDALWVAEAGLTATCVDTDAKLLRTMEGMYPSGWEFVEADAYTFAETTDRQWDVVSLDCPSNQFQRCADHAPTWCRIAKHAVILGTGLHTLVKAPAGWKVTDHRKRSNYLGGVWWTNLERAWR